MIRRIINGVRVNNGKFDFKEQYNEDYNIDNGYNKVEEENITLWGQAGSIFGRILVETEKNSRLILDVLDVLKNFSRNDMLQLLR